MPFIGCRFCRFCRLAAHTCAYGENRQRAADLKLVKVEPTCVHAQFRNAQLVGRFTCRAYVRVGETFANGERLTEYDFDKLRGWHDAKD